MTLPTTFQGQDDPEWSKQYQKWIPHTRISWNRGITRVYTLKHTQNRFSSWPTAAIFDFAPRSHIFYLRAWHSNQNYFLYRYLEVGTVNETFALIWNDWVSGPPTIGWVLVLGGWQSVVTVRCCPRPNTMESSYNRTHGWEGRLADVATKRIYQNRRVAENNPETFV